MWTRRLIRVSDCNLGQSASSAVGDWDKNWSSYSFFPCENRDCFWKKTMEPLLHGLSFLSLPNLGLDFLPPPRLVFHPILLPLSLTNRCEKNSMKEEGKKDRQHSIQSGQSIRKWVKSYLSYEMEPSGAPTAEFESPQPPESTHER